MLVFYYKDIFRLCKLSLWSIALCLTPVEHRAWYYVEVLITGYSEHEPTVWLERNTLIKLNVNLF